MNLKLFSFKDKKRKFKLSTAYLFMGPSIFLILIFYFLPIILIIMMSFSAMDQTFEWKFVGVENFIRIFYSKDPIIPMIIQNTIIYVAGALPLTIGFSLLVALLTLRINKTVGLFFKAIFFIPRVIPPVVWGFLWTWSFEGTRYGVFNQILEAFGIKPVPWLIKYPMQIVILANGFLGVSLAMLVFISAIAGIPVDLIRAADADGASYLQLCRYIIVPLMKWPIVIMTIWHLMSFMNSYVYILLITGGGPYYATSVWSLYSYTSAFQQYQYGYGSSLMMILVFINSILFYITWKIFGVKRLIEPTKVGI
jgi:inositol-phosphate transport system permease protein